MGIEEGMSPEFMEQEERMPPEFMEQQGLPETEASRLLFLAQARKNLDDEFSAFLDKENSSGRTLFAYVHRELNRFGLAQYYCGYSVLSEAYVRAVEAIEKGKEIRDYLAWVRATIYRIIREWSRKHQRTVSVEPDVLDSFHSTFNQEPVSEDELKVDITVLMLALQLLPSRDQRLLHLKIVEGRKWSEIREILRREEGRDFDESVLRKRKERALIRLRKKYHALKPPF